MYKTGRRRGVVAGSVDRQWYVQSEAVVEVRHVVVRGIELRLVRRHHFQVLLVRDVEGRASNPALAVQCYFIIRKADVQCSLMSIEPRVLDGQHPRGRITFVVMRVPPARRRHEDRTVGPVHSYRIDDITIRVQLPAHQRIHFPVRPRGGDGHIQCYGVVAVRFLYGVRSYAI